MKLPEENLLYFLEKNSPSLKPWQREMLRIVRNLAQYFYPQRQTKVMNEGCATFVHYTIMNMLYDRGLITEGALFEFLHSHTSVVFQPEFDDQRYYGHQSLRARLCDDGRHQAHLRSADGRGPRLVSGDSRARATAMAALKDAWANYRDESFIEQFLSPKVMRDFRLFALFDKADDGVYHGRRASTTSAATARCARRWPANTTSARRSQHPGRGRRSEGQPHALPRAPHAPRRAAAQRRPRITSSPISSASGATTCGSRKWRRRA